MKVYTKIVIDIASNDIIKQESFEYQGDVTLCLGGGGQGTSTTTADSIPPYAVTDAQNYLARANVIATDPAYDYLNVGYTGPTYAAQNSNEIAGIANLATRGVNGNTTVKKGETLVTDTMDDKYLTGAQFLSSDLVTTHDEFETMLAKTQNKPTNTFTTIFNDLGANAYLMGDLSGDNIAQDLTANTATRYLNRSTAAIYEGNYRNERELQRIVIEYGIPYADESVRNAELLRKAGLYAREYTEGGYDEAYRKYTANLYLPLQRTEVLGNALRSLIGTHKSTTQTYYKPSPMIGILTTAAGIGMIAFSGGLATPLGAAMMMQGATTAIQGVGRIGVSQ